MRTKTKKRREWNDWLENAKEYYRSQGDLLVPSRYVTPGGCKLGRWIERQRAIYNGNTKIRGSLCADQIASLNAIGMVWKLENRYKWEKWLELCDKYVEEKGDLLVPRNYVSEGICLGNWIGEQRKKYHDGLLTEQQISELDKRQMVWSLVQHRAWEDWFADAKAYYAAHGDLLVPRKYETPGGALLGQWVFDQRNRRINGKKYSEERVRMLDSIGMIWDLQLVRDDEWDRMYQWISIYVEEYGKLPLWPRGQAAPDGRSMDGWIRTQRKRLNDNKLSVAEEQRLEDIGIRRVAFYPECSAAKQLPQACEKFI